MTIKRKIHRLLRNVYGPVRRILIWVLSKLIWSDDVEWVVNDIAELGVKIGPRQFYMYKGRSLEYQEGTHLKLIQLAEIYPHTQCASYKVTGYYCAGDGWKPVGK